MNIMSESTFLRQKSVGTLAYLHRYPTVRLCVCYILADLRITHDETSGIDTLGTP